MSDNELRVRTPERPVFPSQRESGSDPTRANISLHTGINGQGRWEAAVASLDSGTEEQWVSDIFLARFSDIQIEEVQLFQQEVYTAFSGQNFRATRGVIFTWRTEKSRQTRKGVFRVVKDGPFDVIIGSKLLFAEGIYYFNETALLFFHRPAREGEERRMQDTLASQEAEVRQYTTDQVAAQIQRRQQQRDDLELNRGSQTGYTPTSEYGGTSLGTAGRGTQSFHQQHGSPHSHPRSAYFQPSSPNTSPFSPSSATNTGTTASRVTGTHATAQPPFSQSFTSTTTGAGYRAQPINGNMIGAGRYMGPSARSSDPRPQSVPHSLSNQSLSGSTLPAEQDSYGLVNGSQEQTRWICSRCQHRNDPASYPERCAACDTRQDCRGRQAGRYGANH